MHFHQAAAAEPEPDCKIRSTQQSVISCEPCLEITFDPSLEGNADQGVSFVGFTLQIGEIPYLPIINNRACLIWLCFGLSKIMYTVSESIGMKSPNLSD